MAVLLVLSACTRPGVAPVPWPSGHGYDMPAGRTSDISLFETACIRAGLVDIHSMDTSIKVDIRYGSTRNFMRIDFYEGFNKCYLQQEVAEMLVNAQQRLKRIDPDLTLLVWDAARPQSVQEKMWKAVKPPPGMFKGFFVSNPRKGSLHNFGCAVDVTIVHNDGTLLDMGTDFDHFGPEAYPVEEIKMLKNAKLTQQQVTNRHLLRSVMYGAGFWNIQTEWWHFNAMRREVASRRYSMIP